MQKYFNPMNIAREAKTLKLQAQEQMDMLFRSTMTAQMILSRDDYTQTLEYMKQAKNNLEAAIEAVTRCEAHCYSIALGEGYFESELKSDARTLEVLADFFKSNFEKGQIPCIPKLKKDK